MNSEAADKVAMLKSSMRCFHYGLWALVPVLGLPFAVAALWTSSRVRVQEELNWNGAKLYRMWGVLLASAGTVFWLLVAALIAYNEIISDGRNNGWYGGGGE